MLAPYVARKLAMSRASLLAGLFALGVIAQPLHASPQASFPMPGDFRSLDVSTTKALPAGDQHEAAPAEQPVSPKTFVPDILHDQKRIWSFPLQVVRGRHLKPTLAIVGVTAGLVALDPYTEPYFRNNSGFQNFKTGPLRGRNTSLAITLVPAGMFLGGLAKKDSYAEDSGLRAFEALVDAQIVELAIKYMNGRQRPSDIPVHGNFRNTWFKYSGSLTNPGSFPSGHAISAFGVASVFAHRYRAHRWVPWLAYGAAAFISISRIPDQAHFPSDVFAGAALGYLVGHYVVSQR